MGNVILLKVHIKIKKFIDHRFESKTDEFVVTEDLEVVDPEVDSAHFIAILVKCLSLLDKLPLAVNVINNKALNV